jgi:phosphoglycerate dehydrogenase-like enzyme
MGQPRGDNNLASLGDTLAMAEHAVAGILHFAKGLHRAAAEVAVRRRDLRELCVD